MANTTLLVFLTELIIGTPGNIISSKKIKKTIKGVRELYYI